MLNYYPDSADSVPGGKRAATYWIDLLQPTPGEIAQVEAEFDVKVPSRGQLDEIESSSRMRSEGEYLYLSMPVGTQRNLLDTAPTPVGFVLSPKLLVTVRYADLQSFANVRGAIAKNGRCVSSTSTFVTLLEAMVDVAADVLEKIASDLGGISRRVFRQDASRTRRASRTSRMLRQTLTIVGDAGEHLSQIREGLMGLERIIGFVAEAGEQWLGPDIQARLKTARKDLDSLADFEAHLSGKVQFLLDAILGYINTEQNDIFKVLTIVSVVGIPPTLIASMYGMNFHNMPELSWPWGYQYGLGLIALSTFVPILWFKWRGWW